MNKAKLAIYNPLPGALRHYEQALRQSLELIGESPVTCNAPNAEIGRTKFLDRGRAAVASLIAIWRVSRGRNHVVVLWPTWGLLEPLLWACARAEFVTVLVHDPTPLRRQIGMSALSSWLGSRASKSSRISVITHTNLARRVLHAAGWEVGPVLPHPMMNRSQPQAHDHKSVDVLVAGQYKSVRDIDTLSALVEPLRARGCGLRILGRGWPTVPGWHVDNRFATEEELDQAIVLAGLVLIPYTHFYQSGIAMRALELGSPVVGPRHEFLEDLFGEDWAGLVEDVSDVESWHKAIEGVLATPNEMLLRQQSYIDITRTKWQRYLNLVV